MASEEASWISGVNFVIDGGMTVKMIYIDENVIQESLSTLFEDEELSTLIRKLIDKAKMNREGVKKLLKYIV